MVVHWQQSTPFTCSPAMICVFISFVIERLEKEVIKCFNRLKRIGRRMAKTKHFKRKKKNKNQKQKISELKFKAHLFSLRLHLCFIVCLWHTYQKCMWLVRDFLAQWIKTYTHAHKCSYLHTFYSLCFLRVRGGCSDSSQPASAIESFPLLTTSICM